MTHLVLANKQAPGDILMMTCAVRDLMRQYPGQFTVSVQTSAPELWKNNPHIVSDSGTAHRRVFGVGYTATIRNSNQRKGHFAGGFVYDLASKLGLRITLSECRPDIFLSDEERDPTKAKIKETPYWVIMAGGKKDFTAKMWEFPYWQTLADSLRSEGIVPVQVGSSKHLHTPVPGAVNLIGKTSLRDLLSLIYHSKGIICPVTCGMHMAAGLNKPCIVLAGGREPWWWEAYTRETWEANASDPVPSDFVEHSYLHTLGQLQCCMRQGCWKSGVGEKKGGANCVKLIQVGKRSIPSCMHLITPDKVMEAVRHYMNGNVTPLQRDVFPLYLMSPLVSTATTVVTKAAPKPEVHVPRRTFGRAKWIRRNIPGLARPTQKPRVVPEAVKAIIAKRGIRRRPLKPKVAPHPVPTATVLRKDLPDPEKVTIGVLLYGDYPNLARQCLDSLYKFTNTAHFELRLGLNAVGSSTWKYVEEEILPRGNVKLYKHDVNAFKYPVLREMAKDLTTEWFIWFDDDSYAYDPNWLPLLFSSIRAHSNSKMFGNRMWYKLRKGQLEWIKKATWYKGIQWLYRNGNVISNFLVGGWWAIKSECLRTLDWPDPRLSHNGGDVMLGEAMRQNGFALHHHTLGVKINTCKRRGASQKHPGL